VALPVGGSVIADLGAGPIGLCTDSNAQLPDELVERFDIEVVPLTVTIDDKSFREGIDLDADQFYARFAEDARPSVSTAAPSPGAFADAYERLVERGAREILSVHIGSAISATLNAAHLAAGSARVPVRLVDTGSASFVIACCVWEAAVARCEGASLEGAAAAAEAVASRCGNVFVVTDLAWARSGGRLSPGAEGGGVPVLGLVDGRMERIASAADVEEAANAMAAVVLGHGQSLRVGVGTADTATDDLGQALEDRLRGQPAVLDLVRYRVGPSVGAHTGPGTAGAVFYPSSVVGAP